MLERLLQVNIAAMAALGTILLGMGQQSLLLPTVAVFAAVTSVWFTDVTGWFRLNRNLANLAAIAAVGWSLSDFFGRGSEQQLISIANLLIYLQLVLLYQEKSERVYWQLAILSLLQVVVAAALNLGFQFGILLVLYLFVAVAALTLFFFQRETARFAPPPAAPAAVEGPPWWMPRQRRPLRFAPQEEPPPAPLMAPQPVHRPLGQGTFAAIAGHILRMGLATLLIAAVVFCAVPRVDNSVWQGPASRRARTVGFPHEVSFDRMGPLLLSSQDVMRATFYDAKTDRPYPLVGEPYFRGMVLSRFDASGAKGRWTRLFRTVDQASESPLPAPAAAENLVRQDFVLESPRDAVLFAVFPVFEVRQTPAFVRWNPLSHQLYHTVSEELTFRTELRYALATTAFRRGVESPVIPVERPLSSNELRFLLALDPERPERFVYLEQIAADVLAQAGVSDDDPYAVARTLERHFRDSGLYTYSLDPLVQRADDLDPIEDFVANHRTGHCEYFAGALALMLRSRGIPARLVVGYRGGEFNPLGHYWQVKQLHAHAWVEAYLTESQVPAEWAADIGRSGGWLRLDPTPSTDHLGDGAGDTTLWDRSKQLMNYIQLLWSDYVLGLNRQRQQESLYQPVAQAARGWAAWLGDRESWRQRFAAIGRRLGRGDEAAAVRAGQLAFALLVLAASLAAAAFVRQWLRRRRTPRRGVRLLPPRGRRRHAAPPIEFYLRLEQLLARQGLRRRAGQTQRELARAAEAGLTDRGGAVGAALRRIVEAFYRVRFGRAALAAAEAEAVEQALDAVAAALAAPPSGESAERQAPPPSGRPAESIGHQRPAG